MSTVAIVPINVADSLGRAVFVLSLPSIRSAPTLKFASPHFACLVACDSTLSDGQQLLAFGRWLISQGASYVCAWGPGCGDFEAAMDQAAVEVEIEAGAERPVIMTTSHPDESLADALEFLSTVAWPDDGYAAQTGSAVAISIGNAAWATEMREWLAAQRP